MDSATEPDTGRGESGMHGRSGRERAAVLVGTVLLAMAVGLAFAPVAGAAQPPGQLRLGHLSPGTGAVVATISGPEGAGSTEQVVARDAAYGDVTGYLRLVPGRYTVTMRPVGSDPAGPAPLSAGLQIAPGTTQSLFFFDTGSGQVRGDLVPDDLTAPAAGSGRVRIVQGVRTPTPLQALAVGGPRLATDLAYGAVTDYATVAARTWDVRLSSGAATEAAQLPVGAGSVTTVVVTGGPGGALTAHPITDTPGLPVGPAPAAAHGGVPPPRGGVPAGAGGTADDDGPGVLPLVLCLLAAPVLVYGTSVLRAARRRG
ncbi:hypothetical protein Ae717Ps2_4062c [Pseudonocardia sp. Ae717_Ps2]|nr:hypothetical protein Ae717Ps2_4062c [Pseudonocardia sp. Ae717_Ps2]